MDRAHDVTGPMLEVRGLTLWRGGRLVLDAVSLSASAGETVALMGDSGSGKTTVLRAIAGLEPFASGEIEVGGTRLVPGPAGRDVRRALRSKVGLVFQFHCLFEHLSALDNVCLAPIHVHKVPVAEARVRALDLLRQLGVDHRARALPRELSGGEAQRVAIARMLATDPPLVLMDEPTASLDPGRRAELVDLLRATLGSRSRALVIATHDLDVATRLGSRIVRIGGG